MCFFSHRRYNVILYRNIQNEYERALDLNIKNIQRVYNKKVHLKFTLKLALKLQAFKCISEQINYFLRYYKKILYAKRVSLTIVNQQSQILSS